MATALQVQGHQHALERLARLVPNPHPEPERGEAPLAKARACPAQFATPAAMVSLRPMKAIAESFDPSHPLRILLMGEPDEVPADEYLSKVRGWFRLMKAEAPK